MTQKSIVRLLVIFLRKEFLSEANEEKYYVIIDKNMGWEKKMNKRKKITGVPTKKKLKRRVYYIGLTTWSTEMKTWMLARKQNTLIKIIYIFVFPSMLSFVPLFYEVLLFWVTTRILRYILTLLYIYIYIFVYVLMTFSDEKCNE